MNTFIVFTCVIATSLAFPTDIAEVYLTEDTAGNYKLSFKSKAITRNEQRSADGNVLGSYTFIDPEGTQHELTYTAAAEQGFLAKSADVPASVPEGEEVVKARAQHLAVVAEEQAKYPHGVPTEKPVPLTEVLAKLVVPEIASLPAEAVPAEDEEISRAKIDLLKEYARILGELAQVYKQVHQA